jgi:uncharacterized protein (TIGR02757 family)
VRATEKLTPKRAAAIREALFRVEAACDLATRREADPVSFVHRYEELHDQEIVALLSSSFAFGNAKALRGKIAEALRRLGPSPSSAADEPATVRAQLRGFKHRLYDERHVTALLVGARKVQKRAGSLGAALATALEENGDDLLAALVAWTGAIRSAGGLDKLTGAGAAHILPNPGRGGANKRLMLLLRWMARPADGVDLGLWDLGPSRLVIPLDVHLHKLGKNLGFTSVKSANWKAALEVTAALRRFDPDDPTRFDFSLCHLGMVQRCPSRKDPKRCEGCGVKPVCRHWAGR